MDKRVLLTWKTEQQTIMPIMPIMQLYTVPLLLIKNEIDNFQRARESGKTIKFNFGRNGFPKLVSIVYN